MKKTLTSKLTVLSILGGSLASLSGVTLVEYTFDSTGAVTDYTPDVVAGVSANSLNDVDTAGNVPDSNGSSFTELFTPGNVNSGLRNQAVAFQNGGLATGVGADLDDAILNDQYFSFTVSADPGNILDLDNLTFNTFDSQNASAQDFAVRSSLDNFAVNLDLLGPEGGLIEGGIGDIGTDANVDLSGSLFDSVTEVEFRIYLDNREADGNGGSGTAIDNLNLDGEVGLVPEPSTALLSALAGLGLLARRRR